MEPSYDAYLTVLTSYICLPGLIAEANSSGDFFSPLFSGMYVGSCCFV